MEEFDLGVAWCWEYDREMVFELENYIHQKGLTIYQIAPYNLEETLNKLKDDQLKFKHFLDRASDQNEEFERLVQFIKTSGIKMLNDFDKALWSSDKATMHLEFLSARIDVPYTIILSPYEEEPDLRIENLEKVGIPFVLKPARGGSSEGVVMDAKGVEDIKKAREEFWDDKYLIQQKIDPVNISGKRCWFRVFYSCGEVFPCFWDDLTKLSEILIPEQIGEKIYKGIEELTKKISQICNLDLFSTEIALTENYKLIVVDYVNDQCDLRKKSLHYDGIPDEVVQKVLYSLVEYVYSYVRTGFRENLKRY
jgi:6-pyruvoyl-tetrahydropterin synthase